MAILQSQLSNLSKEELIAKLVAAEAAQAKSLRLKVSEKGAVSLYGMGQWPVTLYASQWEKVLAFAPQIEAFLKANAATLARKA